MRPWFYVFGFVITFCSFQNLALAFIFNHTDPIACDDVTVMWQGGVPPFHLHLLADFQLPLNISIPGSVFSNGQGSVSATIPFAEATKMIIVMSDAGGFGAGSVSGILEVGPSHGGTCDTTPKSPPYTFGADNTPQQCRSYLIDGYDSATLPATFYGIIPHGQIITIGLTGTSYDWMPNIAGGTDLLFTMVDAQGRSGGDSHFYTVLDSNVSSCLNSNSPSSTSDSLTFTSTATSTTTSTSTSTSATRTPTSISATRALVPQSTSTASSPTGSSRSHGGIPVGGIVGIVIGAIVSLATVILLSLCLYLRKRDEPQPRRPFSPQHTQSYSQFERGNGPVAASEPYSSVMSAVPVDFNPYLPQHLIPLASTNSSPHWSLPYQQYSGANSAADFDPPIQPLPNPHHFPPPLQQTYARGRPSSTSTKPSRNPNSFGSPTNLKTIVLEPPPDPIIHTDAEDAIVSQPGGTGVDELPPRYSELRH